MNAQPAVRVCSSRDCFSALECAIASCAGALLTLALRFLLPVGTTTPSATFAGEPQTALTASLLINLASPALAFLLLALSDRRHWQVTRVWLRGCLLCACAFAGVALLEWRSELWRPLAAVWLLTCAHLAAVTALLALAELAPLGRWRIAARQAVLLLTCLAVTSLFWSRAPVLLAARQTDGGALAKRLTDAVTLSCPPFAVVAAWRQEFVSPGQHGGGTNFDLIRGPLTYEIWVGSHLPVAYPQVLPRLERDASGTRTLRIGLVAGILLYALTVIGISELLSRRPLRATARSGGTGSDADAAVASHHSASVATATARSEQATKAGEAT